MASYYEEKVIFSRESVVVCIPHELYGDFLRRIREYNNERLTYGFSTCFVESLRPNLKRKSKESLSYEEFKGAYIG